MLEPLCLQFQGEYYQGSKTRKNKGYLPKRLMRSALSRNSLTKSQVREGVFLLLDPFFSASPNPADDKQQGNPEISPCFRGYTLQLAL